MSDRAVFDVRGMHCASCVQRLTKALGEIEGVEHAEVNLATEEAVVETGGGFDPASVRDVVGFQLFPRGEAEAGGAGLGRDVVLAVLFAALAMVFSMAAESPWAAFAVTLPALLWCGRPFTLGALRLLRHRAADMNTLVALGTWTAFLWSCYRLLVAGEGPFWFDSAAMIIAFVLQGKI